MVYHWFIVDMLAHYAQRAQEISEKGISERSKRTYDYVLGKYEKDMRNIFQTDPYPLSIQKMTAYLAFRQEKGKAFSTLQSHISAFSHYLRCNNEENLTLSIEFKRFKAGLKREMLGAKYPHQKEPFLREWFDPMAKVLDLATRDDRLFFLTITMAYHFFMRISEVLSLRPMDIEIDVDEKLMKVNFWKTKTDQFGKGTVCYMAITDDLACPARYCDVLKGMDPAAPIWNIGDTALNAKLRAKLTAIGVPDVERYSFHSFRRGGAYHASERGVQDCVIKAHGRWKSDAYMRYVRVDAVRAGKAIAEALNG